MSKVLVKFKADYADEFDVSGFYVTTQEEWDEHLIETKEIFNEDSTQEVYFGTNEAIEYRNFDHYLRAFTVVPINDAEAAVLDKLFPSEFGHICQVGM